MNTRDCEKLRMFLQMAPGLSRLLGVVLRLAVRRRCPRVGRKERRVVFYYGVRPIEGGHTPLCWFQQPETEGRWCMTKRLCVLPAEGGSPVASVGSGLFSAVGRFQNTKILGRLLWNASFASTPAVGPCEVNTDLLCLSLLIWKAGVKFLCQMVVVRIK